MVNPWGPLPRLEGVVELLDCPGSSDEEIRGSLRDLARLNRYFGGVRTVLLHMTRMAGEWPQTPLTILDIGTGGADIPRAICRWAREQNIHVTIEAVDRSEQVLNAASEWSAAFPEISLRRAEAPPLPYPDQSFDYVLSSLFFHHLTEAQGVLLLREMTRIARRGLIVNDLLRSRPARLLTTIVTHLLSTNRLIRHDGPMSVRRGFRPDELLRMAIEAGVRNVRLNFHPWFRIALIKEITPERET
jgi:ubiquinone/menaquinone biosynthesis C-methylase UbiE